MSASVKERLAVATDAIASSSVPCSQWHRSRMQDLSRWMWLSTKPAITRRPSRRSSGASATMRSAISTMRPPAMAMSTGASSSARRPWRQRRSRALAQEEIEGHGGHRDADVSFCSELDVELFQFVGLGFGASDPFLHERHRHDGFAIGGALGIELHVVGEEARDDGRVHGVGHARLFPEQIRALGGGEAFAPDAD